MAYEEKNKVEDSSASLYSIIRLVSVIAKKWWFVVIFMVVFGLLGFIFSRVTYTEQYSSQIIFNVSNKDKNIAGAAATYITQSDAEASAGFRSAMPVHPFHARSSRDCRDPCPPSGLPSPTCLPDRAILPSC